MTLTALTRIKPAESGPLLVIGDRIDRRSADAFRAANIQFLDARGNAFIAFGDVFIDVRGRTGSGARLPAYPSASEARPSANLFSRGRAQVIMALLAWPELVGGRRREIARASGTSLGQAHNVLTHLEDAGFLLSTSAEMTKFDELLAWWTAAYPTGLGPRLELARFHGDPRRPLQSDGPVRLSGETAAGVGIVHPATVTIYLDSVDQKLPVVNRWSTDPDRVRNVFVRRKFWTSPRPDEEDPEVPVQNGPWPMVYADLMATGDARLAEVAGTWRASRAGPRPG
ncbi:type IV toxin-antitoxin system AbiEi family antitoxin [Actinoplanes sp. NPDC051494]|uniref:type IV toxin-antitoxin system AbiEi family antitoxin n=1 Tax=Actinoplanes sp. NPDC051494 TaxID=3363907 RepID=UPI0037B02888